MRNQRLRLCVVASLAIALSACSFTKAKSVAESSVTRFHDQYNSSQFHKIYAEADDGFRKSDGEDKFREYAEAMRRKLGTVGQVNQTNWHLNSTTAGTTVTLDYDTEFSEGKGTERFVFHIVGDKALLFSYNINSPLLITR